MPVVDCKPTMADGEDIMFCYTGWELLEEKKNCHGWCKKHKCDAGGVCDFMGGSQMGVWGYCKCRKHKAGYKDSLYRDSLYYRDPVDRYPSYNRDSLRNRNPFW